MIAPVRIQLSRAKGFRLQEHSLALNGLPCVKVSRGPGSKWGNPFRVGDALHIGPAYSGRDTIVRDAAHAVSLYRRWVFNLRSATEIATLRGKNLACWCKPGAPCHADVLLELANG